MTPQVLWFYINSLFFPYNAQHLAKVPYEEFAEPIFKMLERMEYSELGAGTIPNSLTPSPDYPHNHQMGEALT